MKRSFKPVSDMDNLTKELQQADKIVMLDFYADWCVNVLSLKNLLLVMNVKENCKR